MKHLLKEAGLDVKHISLALDALAGVWKAEDLELDLEDFALSGLKPELGRHNLVS